MVKNRKHTHKGTCQSCGRVQAVKVDGKIAEHGFTVDWGRVGSCDGSDKQPLKIRFVNKLYIKMFKDNYKQIKIVT